MFLIKFLLPLQAQLEEMFRAFGEPATFQFFRSFKRLRVNYGCPAAAAKARIHLHQTRFGDRIINCYFAQVRSYLHMLFPSQVILKGSFL